MEDDLNMLRMEDDFSFFKWKMTSIFWKMEEYSKYSKWETTAIFWKMGDNFKI
jgi:hypothetical protein